jgi:hypothetical protein
MEARVQRVIDGDPMGTERKITVIRLRVGYSPVGFATTRLLGSLGIGVDVA